MLIRVDWRRLVVRVLPNDVRADGPGDSLYSLQFKLTSVLQVIITGAWAEKLRLKPALAFMALWPLLVYYPVAHWVWNQDGWLALHGVLDFAGGITIHTTSGTSALVVAYTLETRRGFHKQQLSGTHSMPLTVIGAMLVWAG